MHCTLRWVVLCTPTLIVHNSHRGNLWHCHSYPEWPAAMNHQFQCEVLISLKNDIISDCYADALPCGINGNGCLNALLWVEVTRDIKISED